MGFTIDQLDAIDHSGADLIVSAAAGSGKTYTLTQRIIKRILRGVKAEEAEKNGASRKEIEELRHGSDISRMLIVTFTRPAANELKKEICSLISEERAKNPTSPHLISQYTKASYADISTIDSFCLKLVRPNFDKLPIPIDASFRIGDPGELSILEEQTMEELIDEIYENDKDDADFLLVANCYSRIWSEQELAKSLLKLRGRLLSTKDGIKNLLKCESYDGDFISMPFGKIITEHILEITEHFIPIYEHYISLLAYDKIGADEFVPTMKSDLEYIKELDASIKQGDSYDELSKKVNGFEFNDFSTKRVASNKEIDISAFKGARNSLISSIKEVKKLFVSSETEVISSLKQNARICRAIYNVLKLFDDKLLTKKRLLSVFSFNDISKFALMLLKDKNGKMATEIASKYDEIYIDEYQDTNSVQDEIFATISNKNRFMVGDIKQSIYRFRSAEPEIFKWYRKSFSPKESFNKETSAGKAIFMSENFRCDKSVIELSNIVSNYMFENSKGIPYTPKDQLVYSKDLKRKFPKLKEGEYKEVKSEVHIVNTKGKGKVHTPYLAEYVALQIKELLKNGTLPQGGKIKESDITILLRNSSKQIPIYVEALQKHGINSVYNAEEDFFETPHIMLVLCILNAIDNPSRDIYLVGAMRSEIFGFSLAELVKIKKKIKGTASLYSTLKNYKLDDDLGKKITEFLGRLSVLKKEIKKKKAHDALSHIYTECGILTMCKSQERADLMKLYNIARMFEGSSYKGVFSFLRHIDNISQNYDSKAFKGDSTKPSVQLMSIHASKGLQFPICFVCGIENSINYSDSNNDLLFHRDLGVAGFVGMDDGLTRFNPLVRKCIALKLKKEANEEEMRILYVAMTRAEQQLIMVGGASEPKKVRKDSIALSDFTSCYDLYNANSYMKFILGALKDDLHPSYNLYCDTSVGAVKPEYGPFGPFNLRPEIDSYKEIFGKRFNFKYEYEHIERIPSKISVSNLEPDVLDNKNQEIEIPELDTEPKFLASEFNDEKEASGTQVGIATHVFLQFCDFKNLLDFGFEAELDELKKKKFITENDARNVNKDHINKFRESDLIKQILDAKKVYREFRFNIMLDANEFTEKKDLDGEKILVQGVMDCILITKDDRLILVDYKTDNVPKERCQALLERRYKKQLSYYKRACELMFERRVDEVKLYSVPNKIEVIIK